MGNITKPEAPVPELCLRRELSRKVQNSTRATLYAVNSYNLKLNKRAEPQILNCFSVELYKRGKPETLNSHRERARERERERVSARESVFLCLRIPNPGDDTSAAGLDVVDRPDKLRTQRAFRLAGTSAV